MPDGDRHLDKTNMVANEFKCTIISALVLFPSSRTIIGFVTISTVLGTLYRLPSIIHWSSSLIVGSN